MTTARMILGICVLLPLAVFVVISATELTLCDVEFFNLPMFNVDLHKFQVFRNDREWEVDFQVNYQPAIRLLPNRTIPEPILKQLETASEKAMEVFVAKHWDTNVWLLFTNKTMYQFDEELITYPLNYSKQITALFYCPLDKEFYAISGKHIFIVHDGVDTVEYDPIEDDAIKDLSEVRLVFFTEPHKLILITPYGYSHCNVSYEHRLIMDCDHWRNGNLICLQEKGDQSHLFLYLIVGFVGSVAILVLLMLFCMSTPNTDTVVDGKTGTAPDIFALHSDVYNPDLKPPTPR